MITKERLEELIKEGAVIYDIFRGDIYPVNLLSLIKLGDVGFEYHNEYYHCDICRTLSDFYETKEDAEWEQEFGRIVRTERLVLPTWEEFSKLKANHIRFISKKGAICRIEGFCDDKSGFIDVVSGGYSMLMVSNYSKETYINACRKAKELFLGDMK